MYTHYTSLMGIAQNPCKHTHSIYILLQTHATILTNPNYPIYIKVKTEPQGTTPITTITK